MPSEHAGAEQRPSRGSYWRVCPPPGISTRIHSPGCGLSTYRPNKPHAPTNITLGPAAGSRARASRRGSTRARTKAREPHPRLASPVELGIRQPAGGVVHRRIRAGHAAQGELCGRQRVREVPRQQQPPEERVAAEPAQPAQLPRRVVRRRRRRSARRIGGAGLDCGAVGRELAEDGRGELAQHRLRAAGGTGGIACASVRSRARADVRAYV
jgi:hypothetical protein